jgi:hypothetical protein
MSDHHLQMKLIHALFALYALICGSSPAAEKQPLKVFILAGQSNMEGPASIETFDYIGDDKYSEWMAHFIRDVRRDVGAPQMPFVIGVMGVGGLDTDEDTQEFRKAMAAPAKLPEFSGNVIAVPTAPFWSEELGAIDEKRDKVRQMRWFLDSKHENYANADGQMSEEQKREHMEKFEAELILPAEAALWKRGASNAGYHYLGCAKTFALMGRAFADALLKN